MRASVLLALLQAVFRAIAASQVEAETGTTEHHGGFDPPDVFTSTTVEVQSRALLVGPGQAFDVTVRIDGSLTNDPQRTPVLLGLQFVPVVTIDAPIDLTSSSELLWKPLQGDKANWTVKLHRTGSYRAAVAAKIPCSYHKPNFKLPDLRSCNERLPLKLKSDFRIRVSQISARLEASWKKPQTIESLSVLNTIPQGALRIYALALDSSAVLQNFRGIVQLAAIAMNGDDNSPLPVIGGQTTAPLIDGVATFPQLQVLQPGAYKLIATADGAQAAESAPLVVTPPASRILRFCEQPPAVVFVPHFSSVRVAVEVLLPTGGRDTGFAGQMQLQLENFAAEDELLQDVYKTHCHQGLCLWDNVLLTGPPGRHQLKATAVDHTASVDGMHRLTRPAVSAPIMFKEFSKAQPPNTGTRDPPPWQKELDMNVTLKFAQAVPADVRVGQPWDLEVIVGGVNPTLPRSILSRERSLRQRTTAAKASGRGGWNSWAQNISFFSVLHRGHFLNRLNYRGRSKGLHSSKISLHRLHVSIAKSWPENLISLTGRTYAATDDNGRGTLSGLTLWLQDQRATASLQSPWVKLRVECVTCGMYKGQLRSHLETPRIFLNTSSVVGVYIDVASAASALEKWRSEKKILNGTHDTIAALALPGRPAQICVQLFDRPFSDVLIKAQHGLGLALLGDASIRISPYIWPMPACWHFAAVTVRQVDMHHAEQRVSFQLFSADSTFSSKGGVRWRGMAAPDGSVRVVVLPSRSFPGRNRLRYILQNSRPSHIVKLSSDQFGQPKWIEVRSSPLKGRARILVNPWSAASRRNKQPSAALIRWVDEEVDAFLQWKAVGLVVELVPPQTLVVLDINVTAPPASSVDVTGQCMDTDAGNALLATVNRSFRMHSSKELSDAHGQEGYSAQMWRQLEVLLDWEKLSPATGGLLHHHVVCEFRAKADGIKQHLRILPKASVDIIVVRKQCKEGEVFTFQRNSCEPCPEDFECSLATLKPCTAGEVSPLGSLTCQVSTSHRELKHIGASGRENTDCPMGMYLSDRRASTPKCSICPAGFSCQAGKREPCSQGTYSPVGSGICYPCPDDTICTDPAQAPKRCPFGWQRRGEETLCTPCPAGKMCGIWSGGVPRGLSEVGCPMGTYTKQQYPGMCVPCPPGYQCPDPQGIPEPCPPGTSSLGGRHRCSAAPVGLIVEPGKEHLPPRPCDDGLRPLELAGQWWCGIEYGDANPEPVSSGSPMRSSPADSLVQARLDSFRNICELDWLDHIQCFWSSLPPTTWCPTYPANPQKLPTHIDTAPFFPQGGGYTQFFTSCGYTRTLSQDNTHNICKEKTNSRAVWGSLATKESDCPIGYVCGPNTFRPVKPGYFEVSWRGGVQTLSGKSEGPKEYPCWKGYRCEGSYHWPVPCPPGTYANDSGTDCIKCPAGWPCPMSRTSKAQLVVPCWPGHYCPEGSASPTAMACPAGTVNHSTGAKDKSACKPCPAGWLCEERSFQSVGLEACPSGHYCPEGSQKGIPCPAGTHTPYPGASDRMTSANDCVACVAGYYCKQGTSLFDMLSQPCAAGRVCPAGTASDKGPKCLPGFYSSVTGLTDVSECLPCPAGHYCDYGDDNSAPSKVTGKCPEGLMSLNTGLFGAGHALRTIEAKPGQDAQCVVCDPGFQCTAGQRLACDRGFYSDGDSGNPTCKQCLAGHYCSEEGTSREQMEKQQCPAGAYCAAGVASVPVPASHPCPAGNYCPKGTDKPVKCGPGTVNPKSGQGDPSACVPVSAGQYASREGLEDAEGSCAPGYYCPEGSTSATMHPCPAGTYGYQSGARSQEECDKCPQGYFCKANATPTKCPAGHYCELGSIEPKKCPTGTFSTTQGNATEYDCTDCPPGKYCSTEGSPAPTGLCNAGYLCYKRAESAEPTDGKTGERCTPGGYCKAGATTKSYCPRGKYNPAEGGSSESDCKECPPGYYCTGSDSTEPDGPCEAGAYCTGGAQTSRQNVARQGHYAAAGSSAETECPAGTFGPHDGLAECYLCARGWVTYSAGQSNCEGCPVGKYCPNEGTSSPIVCPVGTYRDLKYGSSVTSCKQCPPHKACSTEGSDGQNLQACEAGYYCIFGSTSTRPSKDDQLYDVRKAGPCLPGMYCPQGKVPLPCPRGTVGVAEMQRDVTDCQTCPEGKVCEDLAGLEAMPCPKGFFCRAGTTTAERKANLCPQGKFCPLGSASGTDCPEGTFAPFAGTAECLKCPAGCFCENPVLEFDKQPCPKGYFCPTATREKKPCPSGSMGLTESLSNESLCLKCLPGHYCQTEAITEINGIPSCPAGKYSNPGSKADTDCQECPVGYYCPESSSTPIPCKGGTLCTESGQKQHTKNCPEGMYCEAGTTGYIQADGHQCPAGSYCPAGSSAPISCPMGTFLDTAGATTPQSCTQCPAGSYCGAPRLVAQEGMCSAGYYCPEGSFVSRPAASRCPAGSMCPQGSSEAKKCDTAMNFYQPRAGQELCESCPAGFACTATTANLCPPGQYCTPGMEAKKCSAGTFNPLTGSQSVASCLACLPGRACTIDGLGSPDKECAAGHYCVSGASTEMPADEWTDGGGFCKKGFFCPKGSIAPRACTSGKYCSQEKASAPTGPCNAGHYCAHGATEQESTLTFYPNECPSNVIQGICPPGSVCPEGSAFPYKCPAGTIRKDSNGAAFVDCQPCPEGGYCTLLGATQVTHDTCLDGRHCKAGSRTKFGVPCPSGHYCNSKSKSPQKCPAGSYQPSVGALACEPCPPGSTCINEATSEPQTCPEGNFCSEGTQTPCPAGYYRDKAGASDVTACKPCPPGKACPDVGATLETAAKDCGAGYYCRLGAPSLTPTESSCADDERTACLPGAKCPQGYYCPAGSSTPVGCPLGTTGSSEGATNDSACAPCPANSFCPPGGGQWPCDPGFVCIGGASVPKPTDKTSGNMCPKGSFCSGTSPASPCPKGSYADVEGLTECKKCPAGYVCSTTGDDSGVRVPCPQGNFCPEGSTEATKCPEGTFNSVEGIYEESHCSLCPPGKFCDSKGLTAHSGECTAGFYCQAGSTQSQDTAQNWPQSSGKCPPGHYCPQGKGAPDRCPPGTYNPDWGAEDVGRCLPCTEGHYCARWGLSAPEGLCNPGFYCNEGSSTPMPIQEAAGDLCPEGHYCPKGSSKPTKCPLSTFSIHQGSTECSPCPAGYTCEVGATQPKRCPAKHYCELGHEPQPCPGGTKSTATGLSEEGQCIDCGSGQACDGARALGPCAEGYLCLAGVGPGKSPDLWQNMYSPAAVQVGGPCPIGHFCPEGATVPTACQRGTSTVKEGGKTAQDCLPCKAGWYCSLNSSEMLECPAGHYCPDGSIEPIQCPSGTFSLIPQATSADRCEACPAGYVCSSGTVDFAQWPCPIGYYCPEGSGTALPCAAGTYGAASRAESPDSCQDCPQGYFCEGAASQPSPCPAGRVCEEGSPEQLLCPAGSYCPAASKVPLSCPKGYYCPEGSPYPKPCPEEGICPEGVEEPLLCPAGAYRATSESCVESPSTGSCCKACPAGTHAPTPGASACDPCPAGYLCYGGTATSAPQLPDIDLGEPCPAGHYCPAGSSAPRPCPPGTYNDEEAGANLLEACKPCEPDTFSNVSGQTGCFACGSTSTAEAGQNTCSCIGAHRWFQPSQGSCICEGGYESYDTSGASLSNLDSPLDCQPIVRENCQGSQLARLVFPSTKLRDKDGSCIDPSACETECSGGKGGFLSLSGQCMCLPIRASSTICDHQCRQEAVRAHYRDGTLEFSTEADGSVGHLSFADFSANGRVLGKVNCTAGVNTDCAVYFYNATKEGILGLFGVPQSLQEETKGRAVAEARNVRGKGFRRLSEGTPNQAVKFPVQCLQLHDTVAWWVGDQVYPVLLKDSLLNTNTAIDISTFLQLASAVGSKNDAKNLKARKGVTSNLEYFVYTFSVEGVFAFGTNEDNSPQAIFSVVGDGVQCPPGTRYPEATSDSSLAHLGVRLQQNLNVEPDLTIFLLTFACLLVVLVVLLMCISDARKRQYKKRQALDHKDISERKDLILGSRQAALTMKRRLESLLADLIEQRLCKQENSQVLALQPEQLESMLCGIPQGTPQPQAFENAFGALHELSIKFKSFSSMSSHQFHRATKDIALEIGELQKDILTTLMPIKQRLQHRDRLRGQMGPIMENINRLLGELRSADLFMTVATSSTDAEDVDEGEHVLIVKRLLIPANVGDPATLHLRLLRATICGERFTTQKADRFQVLTATARMLTASLSSNKSQLQEGERCVEALSQEKDQLLQEAQSLLTDGCKLLASGTDATESMKERFVEYRRRDDGILDVCRKQHAAAIDAEVSSATQSLIDQEDALLQLHLSRLLSLASAAQGVPTESRNQKASKSLQFYTNECRAHFKQALKTTTEDLQKRLGEALARDHASAEAQQQQRESLLGVLLDQKARGDEEYLAGVHRLERQLLLLCTQLAIQNKKAVEEDAFQAAVRDWTGALQSTMRTEAQNLRRQAKAGCLEESEYRRQKASLASSLELNIQRITREQFANKVERIEQFEREATRAYESLMEATRKRQRLEEELRSAESDAFGSLMRRRLKHVWKSAAEERKLLRNSIITSWSRATANQERLFEFEVNLQETLAAAQLDNENGEENALRLQRELKDRKQQTESSVEMMIDKCRELQGQLLQENLARMNELRHEQDDEIKAAIDEAKASLSEPRELWLRALVCEADVDAETQGNLQAVVEQHALNVAVSCLEAAGQRYYHEAAAEEKETAELESLALVEEQFQAEQLQQRVQERTGLLKAVYDEEFHRGSDALLATFQQHREACKRSRDNIMEAQRQLIQNRLTTDYWLRETQDLLWRGTTSASADEGAQHRGEFAFSCFCSDWEEDLLTWQSGQINERLDANGIQDNRLKQPRGPDWAASCASSVPKTDDGLQGSDISQNSPSGQASGETPQVTLNREFWARSKGFLDSISSAQKEISLAESEWLQKCRGIQGGRTASAADDTKITRAQNTRLEQMKETFRSKAAELRKDYEEEIQNLLKEDKEAEAQIERSRQAEAANLEMSFRVREASQDSPEEREELKLQREKALAEMLNDMQVQRDTQKANIQRRLEKARKALEEKQEQLCQQFEACREEARREFLELSNSMVEKERNDKKAQLLAAARMNPSAENIYALHNQLKEEYREDFKALVLKQMQEKAKYRHNAAVERRAEEAKHVDTTAESNVAIPAWEGVPERAKLKREPTEKTELHQAKVREIQEAAQEAALQDEALGLQEEHLARVIETLREFAGAKDSPANTLLEQARQEKSRLTQERDDLRRFVSARLQEVEKLVLERKQAEEKRKLQESHAVAQQLKMAAKAQEAAARKQAQEKQLQRQQQRHIEEARKLQQFIEAMGSEGKTLDDLRQASERRMEKLRRAVERERQRQREVLASKRNARAARQAKMSRQRPAVEAEGDHAEMKDAQGLLQSIATKCTATIGESADSDAGENDFRKFVWKMDVKAFAEERLQKLGEALVLFLERVESATNSGKQEEGGVVISGELRQTVLQVTKVLQAINVAHSASAN